jgi:Putative auto-transporter adhesin, head GIN domain
MYVLSRFLVASVLLFISPAVRVSTAQSGSLPASVVAQKVIPLTPFSSVELRSGGRAILHHGPTQSVTLVKGSLDYTRVTIADGGRLVIDRCKSECPRGYDLEIEIVTPDIARVSVEDGGTIQSSGSFPRQVEITVGVNDGGTIDIRSMAVDSVSASVYSGGRIFTRPQAAMFASVVDGGIITYWGDARIRKSIKGGGVVTRGTAAEAGQPLSESSPPLPSVPPIPALPPIQPLRNPGS